MLPVCANPGMVTNITITRKSRIFVNFIEPSVRKIKILCRTPAVTGTVSRHSSSVPRFIGVCDGVLHFSLPKRPEPEGATVAGSTCYIRVAIARPGQMKRGVQRRASFDDIAFCQVNERCLYRDIRCWPRAGANHFVEGFVIFRPAIRITGAVFPNCADENLSGAQNFGPRCRYR